MFSSIKKVMVIVLKFMSRMKMMSLFHTMTDMPQMGKISNPNPSRQFSKFSMKMVTPLFNEVSNHPIDQVLSVQEPPQKPKFSKSKLKLINTLET